MPTIAVTIAGRSYRMACGEGEEEHLQDLARHVDTTMASLRKEFGEVGDQRLVIMTAITVADELSEARRRLAELEREAEAWRATTADFEVARATFADEIAGSIEAAAERLEQITQTLNEAGRFER